MAEARASVLFLKARMLRGRDDPKAMTRAVTANPIPMRSASPQGIPAARQLSRRMLYGPKIRSPLGRSKIHSDHVVFELVGVWGAELGIDQIKAVGKTV